MKILGIVGSGRKKGNTDILVETVLNGAKNNGFEIEKIYLSDMNISCCKACEGCAKTGKCVIKDDMQIIYKRIEETQGLVLGSPTYFYNMSGLTKNFLDRLYAYEIFDKTDRAVWISANEVTGIKYAATVSVCEQETIDNMGYTSEAMTKALAAVGWRTVGSVKALHLFERGAAKNNESILKQAELAGERLAKTILLADKLRKQAANEE